MSKADKNKLDAITVSAIEIDYITGVTSSIQDQLNTICEQILEGILT